MFWYWITMMVVTVVAIFGIAKIRRPVFAKPILAILRKYGGFPQISATEMTAIQAGNTGIEKYFFKPKLNIHALQSYHTPKLSAREQAFLDGPVEQLCHQVTDWDIWSHGDVPESVWAWMREHKFFGIIIPQSYGGLGFSRLAHSAIILKLSSHSIPMAITAMVPNSLGPAELLLQYGSDWQKKRYLPKLASGEEIPCFALTEKEAGSDASSLKAEGVVIKKNDDIIIRLHWEKRWITLGSAATLIGVAFRLRDPDHLLGLDRVDLGITCALIPSSTTGVNNRKRHNPLGMPFINTYIVGDHVEIPLSAIIGEQQGIGQGWLMVTQCLAAGRGLSLPALSTGGSKLACSVTTAHARIRHQFGVPIAEFEGVQEPLARIAGLTFIMEAARHMGIAAMDKHGTLAVISAILKYHFTELNRIVINDAMDILGGTGISKGPHNAIAHLYTAAPIGITVEGSNIVTRTLMIFGQGAIRSHPFAFRVMQAATNNDLVAFDKNLAGWLGHMITSTIYALLCYVTRGRITYLSKLKSRDSFIKKNSCRLGWASACFYSLSNIVMLTLGGKLKKQEHISGRFADCLSWLFMSTSILRYVEQHQQQPAIHAAAQWSLEYGFQHIQQAIERIIRELGSNRYTRFFWRYLILPIARLNPLSYGPSDSQTHTLSVALNNNELRAFLATGLFVPDPTQPLARLETAYQAVIAVQPIIQKVIQGIKQKPLPQSKDWLTILKFAHDNGTINTDEYRQACAAEKQRQAALVVDMFVVDTSE